MSALVDAFLDWLAAVIARIGFAASAWLMDLPSDKTTWAEM